MEAIAILMYTATVFVRGEKCDACMQYVLPRDFTGVLCECNASLGTFKIHTKIGRITKGIIAMNVVMAMAFSIVK